jgi:putative FmdB family regulatory protein
MPLYEYECDACRHRFEVIQKFSDPPVEKCPSCGGTVHKLQSAPAIQFKGAGFYITDYAKKEHTAAAKADSDGASNEAGVGSKEGGKEGSKESKEKGKEAGKEGSQEGSKEAGSKEGKTGGKDKTEKSGTSNKSSSTGSSTPSSSSTSSTTSKD